MENEFGIDGLNEADLFWLRSYSNDDIALTVANIMLTAASVGTAAHPGSTEKLMEYWAHGEGAAKIQWAVPCAFCRCLTHLAKYVRPDEVKGLCANLEKRATGHWPNAQHSRTHHCPC